MPFVDLLHPAGDVEFHDFDQALVFEICHRRIVERDVPVLSDAHAAEIDRLSLATQDALARSMGRAVEDLRGVILIPEIGHWVQQEAPSETNSAILDFLEGL